MLIPLTTVITSVYTFLGNLLQVDLHHYKN